MVETAQSIVTSLLFYQLHCDPRKMLSGLHTSLMLDDQLLPAGSFCISAKMIKLYYRSKGLPKKREIRGALWAYDLISHPCIMSRNIF